MKCRRCFAFRNFWLSSGGHLSDFNEGYSATLRGCIDPAATCARSYPAGAGSPRTHAEDGESRLLV